MNKKINSRDELYEAADRIRRRNNEADQYIEMGETNPRPMTRPGAVPAVWDATPEDDIRTDSEKLSDELNMQGIEYFDIERPPVPEFEKVETPAWARKPIKKATRRDRISGSRMMRMLQEISEDKLDIDEQAVDDLEEELCEILETIDPEFFNRDEIKIWKERQRDGERIPQIVRSMKLCLMMNEERKEKVNMRRHSDALEALALALEATNKRNEEHQRIHREKVAKRITLKDKIRARWNSTRHSFMYGFWKVTKPFRSLYKKVFKRQKKYIRSFKSQPYTFKPHKPGKPVGEMETIDLKAFSRNGMFSVRDPKTGTVIVVADNIDDLKTKYPNHEVVEPLVR